MPQKAKLVTIGAFDPPTYAHLRILERARDFLEKEQNVQIVEGITSIIPDVFRNKRTVANSRHRMKMLKEALKDSRWIRADNWQCCQTATPSFYDTLLAVDKYCNIDHDANRISTIFVCSAKLFEQIGTDENDFCNIDDLTNILTHFDTVVVCSSPLQAFLTSAINIRQNQQQLHIVHDSAYSGPVRGDAVRNCLSRAESIKFCTDNNVIAYIYEYGLYSCNAPPIPSRTRKRCEHHATREGIDTNESNTLQTVCSSSSLENREMSLPLKFDKAIQKIDDCLQDRTDVESKNVMTKSCHAAVWTPYNEESKKASRVSRFPSPDDFITSGKRSAKLSALSADHLDKTERLTSSNMTTNNNRAFTSLISFTFEQHNLSCTPETTV